MQKLLGLALLALVSVAALPAAADDTPVWKTVPAPAAMPKPDESGLAPVNDIKMYYAIFNKGGGNPILLLHGGLGNADFWGSQIADFAKDHEVIVADSRGHGRSTRSEQPFGYALMASDVIALLDYLKVDKVNLVGWSDGGIIGLDIAMNHPDRLIKLFAFGANSTIDGVNPEVGNDPVFNTYIEQAGADYARISPTPGEFEAFVNQIVKMWETQPNYSAADLARITTPTAIADGQYEEAILPAHTAKLAKEVPGATLVILPDTSHFAHLQNPAEYNKAVLDFIDGK
ncbi:MAG TPA: alpha/beta hydrolase [Bauldia sp.]|nr:alpha/beta hydrolase [Bauldia sp.]